MQSTIRAAALALAALVPALAGSPRAARADEQGVERAVRDYADALYEVKPELVERSVHPALEKLGFWRPDGSAEYRLPGKMTFEQLRDLAARWNQDGAQGEGLTYRVDVLDVSEVTASAKLTAKWGIDYMNLAKQDGRWRIVQVLWQSHPAE